MAWIRKTYGVPAKRGMRVEYTGEGRPELGTILSANGSHLNIRLDGVRHTMPFHPAWKLRYLEARAMAKRIFKIECGMDPEFFEVEELDAAQPVGGVACLPPRQPTESRPRRGCAKGSHPLAQRQPRQRQYGQAAAQMGAAGSQAQGGAA